MFVSRFLYSFLCFVSFSIYVSLSLCLYPDSYILFYVLCLFLCMSLSLCLYPDSYIPFYVLCLFLCMSLSLYVCIPILIFLSMFCVFFYVCLSLSLSMFVILHLSLSTYRRSFIRVSMSLHVPFYPFNTPLIC